MNPTRRTVLLSPALALVLTAILSGCAGGTTTADPAANSSAVAPSASAAIVETPAPADPSAPAENCIPSDVTAAGIPLVDGTVVCDLVRGELNDGTLSIVIQVGSVDEGFSQATSALTAAGYSAGVTLPEASNFTNGTYTVLVSVTEQDPYGAVVTYALSPA